MIQDEELDKLELQKIEEKKEEAVSLDTTDSLLQSQRKKDLQNIAEDKEFREKSQEVANRSIYAKLRTEAIDVLSLEQKNALAKYTLDKEKEQLDYKIKYEKRLIKEEVKAEVYARKVKNAEIMYGQYYKQEVVDTLDKDGNVIKVVRYKNFTTSKFVNRLRVFANWYNNLAEGSRKIIWTTIKIIVVAGLIVGIGFGLYGIFKWLVNSGIINQLTNAA